MNATKRGKSWMYTFYHDKKRYRKSGFATKREAMQAGSEKLNQLNKGIRLDNETSFVEYYNHWIEVNKKGKVSDTSYNRYKNAITVFEEKYGNLPISKLNKMMYQELINEYAEGKFLKERDAGRSRSSVEKLHICLRQVIQDALHEGLLYKDPTFRTQIFGVKEAKSEDSKFMTLEAFKGLKQYAMRSNELSYLFIYILVVTGARFGEVQKLKKEDIDVKNSLIHIPGTKTKNADRIITLSNADITYINNVIKKRPVNISGYIFDTGFNLITNNAVKKTMDAYLIENKVGKYTLHSIRHTHCSWLIYEGFDIYYISKRLGHANVTITLSVYGHLLQERQVEMDNLMQQKLKSL